MTRRAILAALAAAGSACAAAVWADQNEGPAQAYVMQTVIVTAQKREEDLQDVPISMQAFSGRSLAARGVDSVQQLGQVVPSLQITSTAGFPILFMRGAGTDNFVPSADPSVATYVDGIYSPLGVSTIANLAGIERLEVLKGPQGTLFGRDATAGAINLVTAEPGGQYHVYVEGEGGNYIARSARLAVSGPVTDWLAAGFSGIYSRRNSFYGDTQFAVQPELLEAGRVKLRFHHDNLSLTLTGFRSRQEGAHDLIAKNVNPSPLGRLVGIRAEADNYLAQDDHQPQSNTYQDLVYGVLRWDLPWVDVRLLGSWQHSRAPYSSIDFDASPIPFAALATTNTFSQLRTAEMQLLSNEGGWDAEHLSWVGGVYFLDSRGGEDPGYLQLLPGALSGLGNLLNLPVVSPLLSDLQNLFNQLGLSNTPLGSNGLSVAFRGVIGTRSLSAYSQATYRFTDWLDLTLGGRVQREDRFLTRSDTELVNLVGNGTTTLASTPLPAATAENFSPRAVLGLHPSNDSLLYLSYAVAYKSGTFNIVNLFSQSAPGYIEPERATSYELGAKSEFLHHRVRINVALFDGHTNNLQEGFVSLLSGGAVDFVTVPRATSRGGELEARWLPLTGPDPLVLTLNAAYVDAKYATFLHGPGFQPGSGLYTGNLDLSGKRMVYTPQWSGDVELAQGFQGARGTFELALDEYFNGGYHTDAANTVLEGPYALLSARAAYRHDPWKLKASLFGSNLLDRRYHDVNVQTDFGNVRTLGAPRQYGVRLEWEF